MTLNKMVVLLTASLFCSAVAIFHQPSYYPAPEQYNYTGKLQYPLWYAFYINEQRT